jgi:hypothetical protein
MHRQVILYQTFFKVCLLLSAVLLPVASHAAESQPQIVSVPYTGQTSVQCNGHELSFPDFASLQYPGSHENLFLQVDTSRCTSENYTVQLVTSKDCTNDWCLSGRFSALSDAASSRLMSMLLFSFDYHSVQMRDIGGQYILSDCVVAGCKMSALIWQDHKSPHSPYYILEGRRDTDLETIQKIVELARTYQAAHPTPVDVAPAATSEGDNSLTSDDTSVSIPYSGQRVLEYQGHHLRLPPFLPERPNHPYDDEYLQLSKHGFDIDNFGVGLGIGADCNGAHVCGLYSYFVTKVTDIGLADRLLALVGRMNEKIDLGFGITGYYTPSSCGAYCSTDMLLWRQGDYLYSLGSIKGGDKGGVIEIASEFLKASSSPSSRRR